MRGSTSTPGAGKGRPGPPTHNLFISIPSWLCRWETPASKAGDGAACALRCIGNQGRMLRSLGRCSGLVLRCFCAAPTGRTAGTRAGAFHVWRIIAQAPGDGHHQARGTSRALIRRCTLSLNRPLTATGNGFTKPLGRGSQSCDVVTRAAEARWN